MKLTKREALSLTSVMSLLPHPLLTLVASTVALTQSCSSLGNLSMHGISVVILHKYYMICLISSSPIVLQAMSRPLCPKFPHPGRKEMEWCEIVLD
jgi:hypothetical protein